MSRGFVSTRATIIKFNADLLCCSMIRVLIHPAVMYKRVFENGAPTDWAMTVFFRVELVGVAMMLCFCPASKWTHVIDYPGDMLESSVDVRYDRHDYSVHSSRVQYSRPRALVCNTEKLVSLVCSALAFAAPVDATICFSRNCYYCAAWQSVI